jgi:protease PrsW
VPPVPPPAEVLATVGAPAAARDVPHRRGAPLWQLLASAFGLLVLAAMGLALGSLVSGQTGPVGFLLGTALALVPLPVVVGAFLWVDRHEPEPPRLLVFAFAWGAIVAALTSALLNTASLLAIAEAADTDAGLAATAVLVAPFVEEATKGLGVLAILLLRREEFDGVVDGIVCAGLVGLGFAFSENVLYYGRAYLEAGADSPGSGVLAAGVTFVLRGVFSPFAHPMFTVLLGIGLGVAAQARSRSARLGAPLLGYAAAVALHAAWNLSAVSGLRGFAVGYVVFMVPIFLLAVAVVAWVSGRESRAITRALPAYVRAGWLPAYDVAMVASPPTRRRAREWAGAAQGPAAQQAIADYQDAAAELALLRDRAERGQGARRFSERERALLLDLARARSGFQPLLR